MSLPTGSQILSGPIFDSTVNQLAFLDTATTVVYQWSSSLTNNKGAPVNNLFTTQYNFAQILKTLNQALPERRNATTTIFQDYPQLTDPQHQFDFIIGSTATTMTASFLDEGAGYKNAFGYFFYIIDSNGQPQILTTDPVYQGQGYHYHPTVVFPNASRKNGGRLRTGGGLEPGYSRTLRGNLPDGRFQDVRVGFFLIPNGYQNQTNGLVYNNKPVLFSQPQLNPNYDPSDSTAGIQAIAFEHGSRYYIAFEDIQRPWGDQDFNDLIVMIDLDPFPGSNPNFVQLTNTPSVSSLLIKTPTDLLANLTPTQYQSLNGHTSFIIRRVVSCHTTADKQELLTIYSMLNFKVPVTVTDLTGADVQIEYIIQVADLQAVYNPENNQLVGYQRSLLAPADNDDDETIVRQLYNQTQWDIFVSVSHIENAVSAEDHYLIVGGTNITVNLNTAIEITYRNIMVFGDPHIITYMGTSLTLPHVEGVYRYYQGHDMTIDLETWKIPDLCHHPSPVLREATYIKKVFIHLVGARITIDLSKDHLSLDNSVDYYPDVQTCLSKVSVSLVKNVPDFAHIDPHTQVLSVHVKELDTMIWCAIHPNNDEYRATVMIPPQNLMTLNLAKATGLIARQIVKVG